MKTLRLVALVVVLAVACAASRAHASGPMWFTPFGGVAMPVGNFSDRASTGFDFGVMAETKLDGPWSAGGELGWYQFGGNDDLEKQLSALYGASTNVTTRTIPLTIWAKLGFDAKAFNPYAKFGFGGYFSRTRFEYLNRDVDNTDNVLGVILAGGFTRDMTSNVRWGGELDYHWIGTENKASQMLELRATLGFGGGK